MSQIPILNGSFTDENADFRTSYPRNLTPVPKAQGISAGYLRPSEGIVSWTTGQGADRGAIRWQDVCYRTSGSKLISLDTDGNVTVLGDVGGTDSQVSMDYSFDRLGILSDGTFWYWDTSTLTEVTDVDLGTIIDFIWVDGYFMGVDGEYIIVTELTDPTAVDPLKYGSSEVDPDPILGIHKLDNEPHVVNRYSIEAFDNIGQTTGTTVFPFQRIEGAMISKGAIGTHASCVFQEAIAFVGGGRNESVAVWIGRNGQTAKISTREIDQVLAGFTETELSQAVCEVMVDEGFDQLHIRLEDRTLVYDAAASAIVGEPVWHELSAALTGSSRHLCGNRVWCYGKWIVGDPTTSQIGYLSPTVGTQWGNEIGWEFSTGIMYNDSMMAIIHELELVALTGRTDESTSPTISMELSADGETWSNPRSISVGAIGDRTKRLRWLGVGLIRNWKIVRFRGSSDSHLAFARLEARFEPLAY